MLTWDDLVYDLALCYENYYVILDLKGILCLLKHRTNVSLLLLLHKCHSSLGLAFCQSLLCSQVPISLSEYVFFTDYVDTWLYHKNDQFTVLIICYAHYKFYHWCFIDYIMLRGYLSLIEHYGALDICYVYASLA